MKAAKKAAISITGCTEARRIAAMMLEVMSGMRTPVEAAESLGMSQMKYYLAESRALQGMVTALEPRAKGRRAKKVEDVLEQVTRERDRLRRDVNRMTSLLRLVRKGARLGEPEQDTTKNGRKRRKPVCRAEKLMTRLEEPTIAVEEANP